MTQKFIRKQAGFSWLKRAWFRLHEPRVVSAIYGAVYAVGVIVGGRSVIDPPTTIGDASGDVLMALIASLITLGGVIGAITIATGSWWVERYAAALMILGVTGYLSMVLFLEFTTEGNRLLQAGAIFTAVCFFAVRYYWINDSPFNPRKHRPGPQHT